MVSPIGYFKEVVRELKKVSWSSRKQTVNKTMLVIAVSTLLAVYLGGLDLLFQKLTEVLIK
ncbi:preprotein translocase subunit SecE [Patescibacteria group bacterium]|nr:preprotein translocase subunit SecE [Patescibacteria group bacterium]